VSGAGTTMEQAWHRQLDFQKDCIATTYVHWNRWNMHFPTYCDKDHVFEFDVLNVAQQVRLCLFHLFHVTPTPLRWRAVGRDHRIFSVDMKGQ